jgi:hypothetical protein
VFDRDGGRVQWMALLLCLAALVAPTDAARLRRVMIVSSDTLSHLNTLAESLRAASQGAFGEVGVYDVQVNATFPATQWYKGGVGSILCFSGEPYMRDGTAVGDSLARFHELGGGVVDAVFADNLGRNLRGRYCDRYMTFRALKNSDVSGRMTVVHDPNHQLLAGVSSIAVGGLITGNTHANLRSPNCVCLAEFNVPGNHPVVAYFDSARIRNVSLGFLPTQQSYGSINGQWLRLLVNALVWTAGAAPISWPVTAGVRKATLAVPSVVGIKWEEAQAKLTRSGLTAQRKVDVVTDSTKSGIVLAQTPAGGAQVDSGAVVTCPVGTVRRNAFPWLRLALWLAFVAGICGMAVLAFSIGRARRTATGAALSVPAPPPNRGPLDLNEHEMKVLRQMIRDYNDDKAYWIKEIRGVRLDVGIAMDAIKRSESRTVAPSASALQPHAAMGAPAHPVRQPAGPPDPVEAYNVAAQSGSRLAFQNSFRPTVVGIQARSGDSQVESGAATPRLAVDITGIFWLVAYSGKLLLFPDPDSDQYALIDIEQCFEVERVPRGKHTGPLIERLIAPAVCGGVAGSWTVETKGRLRVYARA